jgi:flagellar protein FliL
MATSSVPPAQTPRTRRIGRKLLLAIAAACILVPLLGGAVFYVVRAAASQAPAAHAPEPQKPIFVPLEPLTMNLQSDGKKRFLHLGIALKVRDEKAQARVAEDLPELRSRLLLLLSNRDPETLATPQDKMKLAEEIRAELDRPMAAGASPHGLTGVVFNAFVVQ